MKLVMVMGASGLLGRYVCAELSSLGFRVCAQSRTPQAGFDAVFDPADPAALRAHLAQLQPDVIINTAAMTQVDDCETQVGAAYRINTALVENLAGWIGAQGERCHLIQVSTDQLYARPGYQNEAEIDVLNVYSLSKYAAELALRDLPNATVLRTNFFGRSRTPGRTSFSDWIHSALRTSTRIRLAVDIEFNPLSLTTLALRIGAVAQRPVAGVFNLGSRHALSKHAFGLRLAAALALPPDCLQACTSAELAFRVARPRDMRMDVSRFEAVYGDLPALEHEIEAAASAYQ